jgi:hypothetical protein
MNSRIFITRSVSQKHSSSLTYKPSLICRYFKSRFLCQSFSSDRPQDGVEDDKKAIREWEPRDSSISKDRIDECLGISLPQVQQTQSSAYEQQCIRKDICNLLRAISSKVSKRNRKDFSFKKGFPATVLQVRELPSSVWYFQEMPGVIYGFVRNAFYGVQGISSDSSEVSDMLTTLAVKIRSCKKNLTVQEVGKAFYDLHGLNEIGNKTDFISVIRFVQLQLKIIVESTSPFLGLSPGRSSMSKVGTKDLVILCQSLVLILPEISTIITMEEYKDLRKMQNLLTNELACRRLYGDLFYKRMDFQSRAERRLYNIASKACRDKNMKFNANSHLFDLFESDIIIRIPPADGGGDIIINIEVDGIHHNFEKKIIFCERKDKYLKSRGVFVSRISTYVMDDMRDIKLEKWVLKVISDAIAINSDASKKTLMNPSKYMNGYIYSLIMFYTAGLRATRPADKSLILDHYDDNSNEYQSIGNYSRSNNQGISVPIITKQYFSDEQERKIKNNLRTREQRERRKIKTDEIKKEKELQSVVNL